MITVGYNFKKFTVLVVKLNLFVHVVSCSRKDLLRPNFLHLRNLRCSPSNSNFTKQRKSQIGCTSGDDRWFSYHVHYFPFIVSC